MKVPAFMAAALAAASLVLTASAAQAVVILNVVGGQLTGAQNVQVGSALYDVQFVDDSCVNIFDGCDDVSDFTFDNEDDARAAMQALLDQVFLDTPEGLFDSQPFATSGCSDALECLAFAPYAVIGAGPFDILPGFAQNEAGDLPDFAGTVGGAARNLDYADIDRFVWTTFTKTADIPVPGAIWLFGVGLAGLAASRRRPHRP